MAIQHQISHFALDEVTQHNEKNFRARQPYRGARRFKTTRDQSVEDEPIGLPHDARRAHGAARLVRHNGVGRFKLPDSQGHDDIAGLLEQRMGEHGARIGADDSGIAQRLARQIEPAHCCVFVEVAQDIGQLQSAAKMVRERKSGLARHAEYAHR